MNLGLIKSGVQLITGFGVGVIADEAIKMVKPQNLKGLKKVAVKVGGFVLSAMVVDKASDYVEDIWNKTASELKDFVSKTGVVTEEEVKAD